MKYIVVKEGKALMISGDKRTAKRYIDRAEHGSTDCIIISVDDETAQKIEKEGNVNEL